MYKSPRMIAIVLRSPLACKASGCDICVRSRVEFPSGRPCMDMDVRCRRTRESKGMSYHNGDTTSV